CVVELHLIPPFVAQLLSPSTRLRKARAVKMTLVTIRKD
ncbi:MAG: hypothetical protein ACI80I_001756, partial [Akkermansiaceae bacterium]